MRNWAKIIATKYVNVGTPLVLMGALWLYLWVFPWYEAYVYDPRWGHNYAEALAFLAGITCPVLAVRALQGWPFPEEVVMARLAVIQHLETAEVEGGHHVHLTHPDRVAPIVSQFMSS